MAEDPAPKSLSDDELAAVQGGTGRDMSASTPAPDDLFHQVGVDLDPATADALARDAHAKAAEDVPSVADMFEMQMLKNHFSQLAEDTLSLSASNADIAGKGEGIKG
ncbi:DUF5407 family protein [Aquabacter sp. CN5-332]|uniref:DUF5407 family protein n=1 Tax=Aquabacter sp. CN5-332 TaxID=3156608 RepID=UPI0032B3763F